MASVGHFLCEQYFLFVPDFLFQVKQWCALLVVACGGFGTMQPQSSSSLLADWHIKWNNKQTRADKYKNMQKQYIHTQINTKTTQTRNVKGTITIRDCWPTGWEQTATGKQKKDVWESFCSKLVPFWSPPKILGISQNVGDLKTALHYFRLIAW